MRDRPDPQIFETPNYILCEGISDKCFLQWIIRERNLPKCDIWFPMVGDDDAGGHSKFGSYLTVSIGIESFIQNTMRVVVLADNDIDAPQRFEETRQMLTDVGFNAPTKPKEFVPTDNLPDVAIFMLPTEGEIGTLESYLLPSMHDKWGLEAAVDQLVAASPANGWPFNKQSKAKLQSILSVTCKTHPFTGLGHLWTQRKPEFHMDPAHSSFDELSEFLGSLPVTEA